jgi:hypothetical protein
VATYSTGITATWNGVAFTEVTNLAWGSGGSRQGRSVAWSSEQGSVAITCLGTQNVSRVNFGTRAVLSISGGGSDLTSYAVWESVAVAPEVNGVTRYTVTLKLLDDT